MVKRILVTAGSTMTMIDRVRAVTNIFTGRTDTEIARYLARQGNFVTLITSNKNLLAPDDAFQKFFFKTFAELAQLMEQQLTQDHPYDAVIHSAAVSDYQPTGVFVKDSNDQLVAVDASNKISSAHQKLYIELAPTFKIVDKIREPWGFKGKLVKFKLQVGLPEDELIKIARKSRIDSAADLIVANCLEWSNLYAVVLDQNENEVTRVSRELLPQS